MGLISDLKKNGGPNFDQVDKNQTVSNETSLKYVQTSYLKKSFFKNLFGLFKELPLHIANFLYIISSSRFKSKLKT